MNQIEAIPANAEALPPRRSDRDLLEEILILLRQRNERFVEVPKSRALNYLWEQNGKLLQRSKHLAHLVDGADRLGREIPDEVLERIQKEQSALADTIRRYDALIGEVEDLSQQSIPPAPA